MLECLGTDRVTIATLIADVGAYLSKPLKLVN